MKFGTLITLPLSQWSHLDFLLGYHCIRCLRAHSSLSLLRFVPISPYETGLSRILLHNLYDLLLHPRSNWARGFCAQFPARFSHNIYMQVPLSSVPESSCRSSCICTSGGQILREQHPHNWSRCRQQYHIRRLLVIKLEPHPDAGLSAPSYTWPWDNASTQSSRSSRHRRQILFETLSSKHQIFSIESACIFGMPRHGPSIDEWCPV